MDPYSFLGVEVEALQQQFNFPERVNDWIAEALSEFPSEGIGAGAYCCCR